jgi:hypothetical protein
MCLISDIAGNQHCLSSRLLDPSRGFLRVVVLLKVGNQHVSTFAREGNISPVLPGGACFCSGCGG